jgi:hypothetical protein
MRLGAAGWDDVPDHPWHGSGRRLTLGMCEPFAQVSRSWMRRLWSRHGVMPSPKLALSHWKWHLTAEVKFGKAY